MELEAHGYTAFAGYSLIGRGALADVVARVKARAEAGETERMAIYDDRTGRVIEVDLQGTLEEVVGRLAEHPLLAPPAAAEETGTARPGRPKLGVVAREVTLLPRHWDWLGRQSGGASAAIRRLVEAARKNGARQEQETEVSEAIHRFLWDLAGNLPHFEEASRRFYRRDWPGFSKEIESWPSDVRDHVERLIEGLRSLRSDVGPSGTDEALAVTPPNGTPC